MVVDQRRVGPKHSLLTGSEKNQSSAGVNNTSSLRQDGRAAVGDALVDAPVERGRRGCSHRAKMVRSDVIGDSN